MRFLAIRSDRQPAPDVWRSYVHKQNVTCSKCKLVYQLWAPLEETDDGAVKLQRDWLNKNLPAMCPNHEDWLHTAGEPAG